MGRFIYIITFETYSTIENFSVHAFTIDSPAPFQHLLSVPTEQECNMRMLS